MPLIRRGSATAKFDLLRKTNFEGSRRLSTKEKMMEDDDIDLTNACADLLGLKKNEAFPLHLLRDKRAGEWVGVAALCRQVGVNTGPLTPALFATWLPDPTGRHDYAVVLFY